VVSTLLVSNQRETRVVFDGSGERRPEKVIGP
jgi:hypothetical protein